MNHKVKKKNCIVHVFKYFTASIGDLMVANWVYQHVLHNQSIHMYIYYANMNMMYINLGDNCIVFEYFMASIGD